MIHLAHILIAADEPRFAAPLAEHLGKTGYQITLAQSADQAIELARAARPDVVVVGPTLADSSNVSFAERLRLTDSLSDVPVVLFAATVAEEAPLAERALAVGADDVIVAGTDLTLVQARLVPLLRLSTMHAELRQRADIARGFGIIAPDKVDRSGADDHSILLIGDALDEIGGLLTDLTQVTQTQNLFEAEDLLTSRDFNAVVMVASKPMDNMLGLCTQIRHNPRLFNLPVVVLARTDTEEDLAEAYRRGASRVLPLPPHANLLRSAVLTLVQRQHLRQAIREALRVTLAPATQEPFTGTYSRPFLDAYLASRVALASAHSRPLTILFFSIPAVDNLREQFGDEAAHQFLIQLGQWISGLLRAEDLVSYYQKNEFAVVLPDTPKEEAEMVMHRIAGIVSYTDFAIPDIYQPVRAWVQVGSADVQSGDTAEALIGRARHNLD